MFWRRLSLQIETNLLKLNGSFEMSADIYVTSHQPVSISKIPVPSEPPMRRAGSLRVRGEKAPGFYRSTNSVYRVSATDSGLGFVPGDSELRRGNSFLERGEKDGSRSTTAVACRPRNVNTEPRIQGALKGAVTPVSPSRTRSLVSFILFSSTVGGKGR